MDKENEQNQESISEAPKSRTARIIEAASGMDENGVPNSGIYIALDRNTGGGEIDVIKSLVAQMASVTVLGRGEYAEIRLSYESYRNQEITKINEILEEYAGMINHLNGKDPSGVILIFMIVPTSLEGKAYIRAYNPLLWVNQTPRQDKPDSEIRLIFRDDMYGIFEARNAVNMDEIKADVYREKSAEREEYYVTNPADSKEEKKDTYLDDKFKKEREKAEKDVRENEKNGHRRFYSE